MQTKFTEEQLRDPDNFANEKVFKKCVHCGMCNATCPTHQLLGDELDGPRGRIYLIKDMLENNNPATMKSSNNTMSIVVALLDSVELVGSLATSNETECCEPGISEFSKLNSTLPSPEESGVTKTRRAWVSSMPMSIKDDS